MHGLTGAALAAPIGDPPPADTLRAKLRAADRAYQANDYATALTGIPLLLLDVRAAVELSDSDDEAAAYALLARTLHLTGNLLIQLHAGDLAQTALMDALTAARRSGNQVVAATVIQGLCWLLMRQGRLAEAAQLGASTADQVEPAFPRHPGELAAWGGC
ncbi:hypothetical protein NKG94_39880 [Micromonospora sp. M12]